jgi:hypothetical protein
MYISARSTLPLCIRSCLATTVKYLRGAAGIALGTTITIKYL